MDGYRNYLWVGVIKISTLNMESAKTEFVVFLRNSDILSTTQRGVTTSSSTFTATAAQTVFTLSNAVTRNVRNVMVDYVDKTDFVDYSVDYNVLSSTVTFTTGITENSSVIVMYDHSSGLAEKIFPDYPEIEYLPNSVPRMGMGVIGPRTKPISIGNTNWLSDAIIRIKVYDKNLKNIDNFITTIRNKVKAAQRSFFHFPLVTISNIGPPLLHDFANKGKFAGNAQLAGKVYEKAIDLVCKFNFES